MSKTGWKKFELDIARALGVERYSKSHLGESVPDVVKCLDPGNRLLIECKNRNNLIIEKEIKEIEKYRENESDILLICYRKTYSNKTKVLMRLKYFKKLYRWIKNGKRDLQFENIVVSLEWSDFKGMVDYGVKNNESI